MDAHDEYNSNSHSNLIYMEEHKLDKLTDEQFARMKKHNNMFLRDEPDFRDSQKSPMGSKDDAAILAYNPAQHDFNSDLENEV